MSSKIGFLICLTRSGVLDIDFILSQHCRFSMQPHFHSNSPNKEKFVYRLSRNQIIVGRLFFIFNSYIPMDGCQMKQGRIGILMSDRSVVGVKRRVQGFSRET